MYVPVKDMTDVCVFVKSDEELECDVELVMSIMDQLTEELIKEGLSPPPLPPR